MDITYEKAEVSDIPEIFRLCRELILKWEDDKSLDLEKVLRWCENKISKNIGEYRRIICDGRLAGFYRFFETDDGWEIDDLYVLPEFQGRGIGTFTVRKCLEEGENVFLYVFSKNQGAVRLYSSLGFEISEKVSPTRYIMRYKGEKI